MNIPVVDLKQQYQLLKPEIDEAISRVMASGRFILGPNVESFEREVANYCGVDHAIGLASGTDALLLALRACGVKPGDEVITTTFSFTATADTITALGAIPVFVDIDSQTFNLDPHQIEAKITPKSRAIVPVHLYGQVADMAPVLDVARNYGLAIIEDNAQALGATYKGQKTGSLGDVGCLSFFPTKNLGGFGDGGMLITNSEEIADHVRRLRSHGGMDKYFCEEQGYNSRLDELQAAVLRVKLKHLDAWNSLRQEHARRYTMRLASCEAVIPPAGAADGQNVYHAYTLRVPRRNDVRLSLAERGIETAIYYPTPLHLQPLFSELGYRQGDFPDAERAAQEVLSVPMYPELSMESIDSVAEALEESLHLATV